MNQLSQETYNAVIGLCKKWDVKLSLKDIQSMRKKVDLTEEQKKRWGMDKEENKKVQDSLTDLQKKSGGLPVNKGSK